MERLAKQAESNLLIYNKVEAPRDLRLLFALLDDQHHSNSPGFGPNPSSGGVNHLIPFASTPWVEIPTILAL
jgi:hypothetical protein